MMTVHHSVTTYTMRIHYCLQHSHAEPVCFLKINVDAFLVHCSQNAITDFSIIQFGHLTSLVLLVTLLSCSWKLIQNSISRHFCKDISYRQRSVLHAINTVSYQLTELFCTSLSRPTLWDPWGFNNDNSVLKYQFLNRESYWILMVLLSQPHCMQANGLALQHWEGVCSATHYNRSCVQYTFKKLPTIFYTVVCCKTTPISYIHNFSVLFDCKLHELSLKSIGFTLINFLPFARSTVKN